ncbi:hypothetical protein BAUCODRAFT_400846 [Baudoinia panamericana UAMH 10762]|uniref:Zn(2)-C6 fungal-type domain-containing protein n=1 Tax=Baudoinia panamericana (strain UAMH 10762) TaxID=717646 RepID=M2NIZ2_BAUPA|nr:uncharacterized protein BAUCODRAFT_400846 [Baudoinia panamericana UAMH 10762]EMC99364.1 hypothetical protein BAUCODRAFT_400846 [Baudoinia panamericana UAMH 10762]
MSAMATSKRARACDACHAIKIKCELGSSGGQPPCERCIRLRKDCIITPPKRQKDRVAELEAQVQALTRLLEAQGLSSTSPDDDEGSGSEEAAPQSGPSSASSKKRRRDGNDLDTATEDLSSLSRASFDNTTAADLDRIVPPHVQARILRKYRQDMVPQLPLVPLSDDDTLDKLRSERPLLLQAITFAACPGVLSAEDQNKVALLLLSDDTKAKIEASEKSLELVQALQISTIWYWVPKHHKHIAAYEVVEVIGEAAITLGLSGPNCAPQPGSHTKDEDIRSIDAWRAWVACYMLWANVTFYLRRPNSMPWSKYHDDCLALLEYSPLNAMGDRLLCQHVRGERLCDTIAAELQFYDMTSFRDVSESSTQLAMRNLQNKITDWQAQIPTFLRGPALTFWHRVATMYLHEPVLHTPTNKPSFTAPFVAERLSVTDFPAPNICSQHITSTHALAAACHGLLDTFCSLDTNTHVTSPGLMYTGRILYATYVLMKLYIAATAPGNTYGAVISPADIQVEHYLSKLIAVASMLRQADSRAAPAVMLASMARLYEWLSNYNVTIYGDATNPDQTSDANGAAPALDGFTDFDWDDPILKGMAADASYEALFSTETVPAWLQPPSFTGSTT